MTLLINVRFFTEEFNEDSQEWEMVEIDHHEFEGIDLPITYERNTVFENGCSQICLTKIESN